MAVAQFVKHVGADNEKFFARHFRADAPGVGVIYGIPVYVFLAEEAVVFVKNCPECFEIAAWIIGVFTDIVAGAHEGRENQCAYD